MKRDFTFQAGGALKGDFPGYVVRSADREILDVLQAGEFCYVLTARQMGKSSLKVRAIRALKKKNWACADVDITRFGSKDATAEQWYFNFLYEVCRSFQLDEAFEDWWDSKAKFTPVGRFSSFWSEFLCKQQEGQMGIFIDEIDSTLSLDRSKFSTDDFFAALRSVYNDQADNEELRRIQFCILGVAAPNDLMDDPARTPFNVGRPIILDNLQLEDCDPLLPGLRGLASSPEELIRAILDWSGGQPYLTQRICQELSKETAVEDAVSSVDTLVERLFLSPGRLNDEANLSNVQRRATHPSPNQLALLHSYEHILQKGAIELDLRKPEQVYLKLTGLVREQGGKLIPNNRIYEQVFDLSWLEATWDKLNRPFSMEVKSWIANEQNPDFLIRGEALRQAEAWSKEREDLSSNERNFLDESRMAAIKEEQEKLRQEERESSRQTLVKQRNRLRVALAFLGLVLLGVLGLARYAFWEKDRADNLAREESKQRSISDSLAILEGKQRNQAETNFRVAYKRADSLRILEKGLVEALEMARISKDTAEQRRIQAELRRLQQEQLFKTFKLTSIAQRLGNKYPSLSMRLLERARMLDPDNQTIQEALYSRYREGQGHKVFQRGSITSTFYEAKFSDDDSSVLVGSYSGEVQLWETQTGKTLQKFLGHSTSISAMTFFKENRRILSCASDGTLIQWDAESGKPIQQLKGAIGDIFHVLVDHNRFAYLFSRNFYGDTLNVSKWDLDQGLHLETSYLPIQKREFLEVNPNNTSLITYDPSDSTLITWDFRKGKTISKQKLLVDPVGGLDILYSSEKLLLNNRKEILVLSLTTLDTLASINLTEAIGFDGDTQYYSTTYLPGREHLFVSFGILEERTYLLYDLSSMKWLPSEGALPQMDLPPIKLISPKGKWAIAGDFWSLTYLVDLEKKEEIKKVSFGQHIQHKFTLSSDGKAIFSGTSNPDILMWETQTGTLEKAFIPLNLDSEVLATTLSRNDKLLGLTTADSTLIVMKVPSGEQLYKGVMLPARGTSLVCSPSEDLVAVGLENGAISLRRLGAGVEIANFKGHKGRVNSLAFSPDGKYLVSGASDSKAILWNIKDTREEKSFDGHLGSIESLAFSPDGKFLLTGSYDAYVYLWEIATGQRIKTYYEHTYGVGAVCFSPSGNQLATGSETGSVILQETSSGKVLKRYSIHKGLINSLQFSPDGKFLYSSCTDGRIRQFPVSVPFQVADFAGHNGPVSTLSLLPEGTHFISGSNDEDLILWEMETGKQVRKFIGHENFVVSSSTSPDGKYLLSGSYDNSAILWEVETGKRLYHLKGDHTGPVWSVAFSPNRKYFCTGSWDSTAIIWDLNTGEMVRTFRGDKAVYAVDFPPPCDLPECPPENENHLLIGRNDLFSKENELVIWDIESGEKVLGLLEKGELEGELAQAIFSPNGLMIAANTSEGNFLVWDRATGKKIIHKDQGDRIQQIQFSSDNTLLYIAYGGERLATYSLESQVEIVKVENIYRDNRMEDFELIESLPGGKDQNRAILTSDYAIELWDLDQGKLLKCYPGNIGQIDNMVFSPSGEAIFTSSFIDYYPIIQPGDTDLFYNNIKDKEIENANKKDSTSNKEVESIELEARDLFYEIPEGQELTVSGDLVKWDMKSGQYERVMAIQGDYISAMSFGPPCLGSIRPCDPNRYLLIGKRAGGAVIWDLEEDKEIRSFAGHQGEISLISFSPDGKWVMACGKETTASIWDVDSGKELYRLNKNLEFAPTDVAFRKGYVEFLVSFGEVDNLSYNRTRSAESFAWDYKENKTWPIYSSINFNALHQAFSPQKDHLLATFYPSSLNQNNRVFLWELETGTLKQKFPELPSSQSFSWAPDANSFLSTHYSGAVFIGDPHTGRIIQQLPSQGNNPVRALYSPNGRFIATSGDAKPYLWQLSYPGLEEYLTDRLTPLDELLLALPESERKAYGIYEIWDLIFGL